MDKIVRVLDAIEADLGVRGWVNGNPVILGKACLGQSAAKSAIAQGVEHFRVCELLLTAAHIQTGKRWAYVPEYNDAPGRTLADVMGVLRIARELRIAEMDACSKAMEGNAMPVSNQVAIAAALRQIAELEQRVAALEEARQIAVEAQANIAKALNTQRRHAVRVE